jgi:hypothetical protein
LWNLGGNGVAAAQRVNVMVQNNQTDILAQVPCQPRMVLKGAKLPPPVSVTNTIA